MAEQVMIKEERFTSAMHLSKEPMDKVNPRIEQAGNRVEMMSVDDFWPTALGELCKAEVARVIGDLENAHEQRRRREKLTGIERLYEEAASFETYRYTVSFIDEETMGVKQSYVFVLKEKQSITNK